MPRREKQRQSVRANKAERERILEREEEGSTYNKNLPGFNYDNRQCDDEEMSYWAETVAQYKDNGPCKAVHCDGTKTALDREWSFWQRFSSIRFSSNRPPSIICSVGRRPDALLLSQDPEELKGYLDWRVTNSRKNGFNGIQKQSSVMTSWKLISIRYADMAGRYIKDELLNDMRNFIRGILTEKHKLSTEVKEKTALYVEDLCVYLNTLWAYDEETFEHERHRVQLPLALIFAGCSAGRPSAVLGLKYKDLQFVLMPAGPGRPPQVALVVDFTRLKGNGKSFKVTFTPEDNLGNLVCDPISYVAGLAFADNAFENNIKRYEDLYTLTVPSHMNKLRIPWKMEWRDRPLFRDTERDMYGLRISDTAELPYYKLRNQIVRLGITLGLEHLLQWYDLRRAGGKKLTESVSKDETQQVMAHLNPDIYRRHYMPSSIDFDCQAIYFGTPRRDDLIRRVGAMHRNAKAPKRLSEEWKAKITSHPEVVELNSKCETWDAQMKATQDPAEKLRLSQEHAAAKVNLGRIKSCLRSRYQKQERKEFHATSSYLEIEKQLMGLPTDPVLLPPQNFELKERELLAKMFFIPVENLYAWQLLQLRADITHLLTRLCQRVETPSRLRSQAQLIVSIGPDGALSPPANALFCPLCFWDSDERVPPLMRTAEFASKLTLGNHIKNKHLNYCVEQFSCPYRGCTDILNNASHFLSHCRVVHNLHLPPSSLPAPKKVKKGGRKTTYVSHAEQVEEPSLGDSTPQDPESLLSNLPQAQSESLLPGVNMSYGASHLEPLPSFNPHQNMNWGGMAGGMAGGSVGLDGVGWAGMGWNEIGWNCMGWNGIGRNGMDSIGMECNSIGWNGTGYNGMGYNGMGPWNGDGIGLSPTVQLVF